MSKRNRQIALATLLASIAFVPACADDADDMGGHEHDTCTELPTITVSADPTTIASGDTVTVSVSVTNFELRDPEDHDHDEADELVPRGTAPPEDYEGPCGGHFHVYLDNTDEGNNPLAMGYEGTVDVMVEGDAGVHTLIVRLNADDHSIIEPEIFDTVDIEIQ